jgi:Flp pilus assembly protein TadD
MGRDKEAAKALADGLHLDPGNLKMLTTEITLLREKDSQVEAIAKLEKAITLHPYDFNLRSLAMLAYQKQGELELAAKQQESMKKLRALKDKFAELHVAAIKDPNDVESRVLLGKVAVELGMLDAAANWYRVALGMDPSNPVARQELSKLMSGETSSQTSDHSNRR